MGENNRISTCQDPQKKVDKGRWMRPPVEAYKNIPNVLNGNYFTVFLSRL
jgi:hypothetical protein